MLIKVGTEEIGLFEDLLHIEEPNRISENLDKVQSLIVCHCLEVYGMIPELHTTLQTLKEFFKEIEKLQKC